MVRCDATMDAEEDDGDGRERDRDGTATDVDRVSCDTRR
jgi:hypothetical protein